MQNNPQIRPPPGLPERVQSKIPAPAVVVSSPPPWIELPEDVTATILQRLGAEELLCIAQRVCSTWWNVCKDPSMWRVIDFSKPEHVNFINKYTVMCRRAVDRSRGQLVDLTIQYFGDDELIEYIVHRSPNLKRLKLGSCFMKSGYEATIVAKLRQLEELHLTINIPCIGGADIAAIGNSCPKLKSFSCNRFKHHWKYDVFIEVCYQNAYAFAIGESMPSLRHVQLFSHWMGNEGHLESFDIRRCNEIDLEGDLGKICRDQIKDLKLPNDSVSDVQWPNCNGIEPIDSDSCSRDSSYDSCEDDELLFSSDDEDTREDDEVLFSSDDEDSCEDDELLVLFSIDYEDNYEDDEVHFSSDDEDSCEDDELLFSSDDDGSPFINVFSGMVSFFCLIMA